MGGGERSLGETGQRRVSLSMSVVPDGFCGTGALASESAGAGRRMGVVVADNVFRPVAGVGILDLVERVGLGSC